MPDIDPYAPRLAKGADVWKVYVEEADKWDKELLEGWNKMLDVILIFAALFSAISTAFVLESSKDLKPDPAEGSATTLLTIAQILLTMSNQSSPTTISILPTEPVFTPSTSAVVVNVLWFTSLILSVAVTLVAMLAKEWCHLFIAGRTGQAHNQARRRQLRIEGLERWGMAGIIPALPTLMHLALFLFAAGLCVSLWSVHLGVAIPVVLISATAAVIYLSATILPFIDHFCPYQTALSRLLKPWIQVWITVESITESTEKLGCDVPMDHLTTRTLRWLISNCENPEAIDVALQSIAGANHFLPIAPLLGCNAVALIVQRIKDCFGSHHLSTVEVDRLATLNPRGYQSVILYARALNFFVSQMGKVENASEQIRNSIEPLRSFYRRLRSNHSMPVSTVGSIGCIIAYPRTMHELLHRIEENPRETVDRLCGLISSVQAHHLRLPSHTQLLSDLLYALSLTPSILQGGFLDGTQDDIRRDVAKRMFAVISSASIEDLNSPPFAHSLAVVALTLNSNLRMSFSTLDSSLVEVFQHHPTNSSGCCILIEELNSSYLLALGLAGLIGVSDDPVRGAGMEAGDLSAPLARLSQLDINWESQASFGPLVLVNTFDLRRYAVETVSNCYLHQLAKSPPESLFEYIKLLDAMLCNQWDDVSWVLDVVVTLLVKSTSDDLQCVLASFLYRNADVVSRHPRMHDVLCEMVARARHETPVYVHRHYYKYLRSITRHLSRITVAHDNDTERVQTAIDALLQQLAQNDLLATLISCACRSDENHRGVDPWQDMRSGPTTRFWVTQILVLARKSACQVETSDAITSPSIADQLRAFCLSQTQYGADSDRAGEVGITGNGERQWTEAPKCHLEDLKVVLMQELRGEPSFPINQPIVDKAASKPANGSHISLDVVVGSRARIERGVSMLEDDDVTLVGPRLT
ncbi:hypothetical protein BDV93DRAFT_607514 [Ceratobasidium sp. AG-I]|nr:hypothetical protein BDV93DRAFT_607514 [Ceratobasidium sp. AG-I]